uniref:Uncharacterized protein n=1 Tax=Magallana gigas TaxID=29159 RepID=K1QNJ8_MAGGI
MAGMDVNMCAEMLWIDTMRVDVELCRRYDGSTVGTVIPVVVVILVLGCCAVAVVFYHRRLKHKQEKDKKVKSVPTMENENYTHTESHDVHRNSILQQSNPTYQLANDAILGSESPYKEAEDGTYDHLGDKNTRKRRVEGIYNCTSSAKLSDSEVRCILGDTLCGRVCTLGEISWAFPMLCDLGNGIPLWAYLCERDTTQ